MFNSAVDWINDAISKQHIKYYEYTQFSNLHEIGSGGFGKVYRANWNSSNCMALKSFNNENVKEIARELTLQREVDYHENIIRFYGITKNELSNQYLLVMEYADGDTLRSYLKNNFQNLDWSDKYLLALQLANAVECLHKEGIVHRDLHSKNILIHQNNVKLADFGLSRRVKEQSTNISEIIGMIPYIDSKMLKTQGKNYKLDEKSDIYSIGVLFWELSSGYPPFSRDELNNCVLILEIVNGYRENFIPGTPREYNKLYKNCWNDDPNNRPTIDEVIKTIKSLMVPIELPFETFDEVHAYESQNNSNKISSSLQMDPEHLHLLWVSNKEVVKETVKPEEEKITPILAPERDKIKIPIAVSIDYGVNYSGFSYVNKINPDIITNHDIWPEQVGKLKTSTALLYDEDYNRVIEWGYSATTHSNSVEHFLLHLLEIPENHKPNLPANLNYKKAITDYLKAIGALIKDTINLRWPSTNFLDDVLIILTISASFSELAKEILKECMFNAELIDNIGSKRLQFITRSEAVAIYALKTFKMHFNFDLNIQPIKFMIIYCDDDKVDLTMREFVNNEHKNIKRSGNFCGEADIIKEFLVFIANKVGPDALKSLRENHYDSLQKMIQEFSSEIKSLFTGNKNDYETYNMDLESVCPNIKKYVTGLNLDKLKENEWFIDFEFEDVKAMFDPVINIIIELISDLLNYGTVSFMFIAGSLSEIKYLQNRIHEEFSGVVENILITPRQSVEAAQGALDYGLQLNIN